MCTSVSTSAGSRVSPSARHSSGVSDYIRSTVRWIIAFTKAAEMETDAPTATSLVLVSTHRFHGFSRSPGGWRSRQLTCLLVSESRAGLWYFFPVSLISFGMLLKKSRHR